VKRQTAEVEPLHERASATPEPSSNGASRTRAGVLAPSAIEGSVEGDTSLRGRQLRFAHALTTPESLPGPLDQEGAARWFTAGPRLTAHERLAIYRRAYHARLVECLADDYAAVQHALGRDPLRRAVPRIHRVFPFDRTESQLFRSSHERVRS
jgi:hypothetical protein